MRLGKRGGGGGHVRETRAEKLEGSALVGEGRGVVWELWLGELEGEPVLFSMKLLFVTFKPNHQS